MKKRVHNSKESNADYMGVYGRKKGMEEIKQFYYYLKINLSFLSLPDITKKNNVFLYK